MLTGLLMTLQLINAAPALQAQPTDWSDQDPSQAQVITDFGVHQTVTE